MLPITLLPVTSDAVQMVIAVKMMLMILLLIVFYWRNQTESMVESSAHGTTVTLIISVDKAVRHTLIVALTSKLCIFNSMDNVLFSNGT